MRIGRVSPSERGARGNVLTVGWPPRTIDVDPGRDSESWAKGRLSGGQAAPARAGGDITESSRARSVEPAQGPSQCDCTVVGPFCVTAVEARAACFVRTDEILDRRRRRVPPAKVARLMMAAHRLHPADRLRAIRRRV